MCSGNQNYYLGCADDRLWGLSSTHVAHDLSFVAWASDPGDLWSQHFPPWGMDSCHQSFQGWLVTGIIHFPFSLFFFFWGPRMSNQRVKAKKESDWPKICQVHYGGRISFQNLVAKRSCLWSAIQCTRTPNPIAGLKSRLRPYCMLPSSWPEANAMRAVCGNMHARGRGKHTHHTYTGTHKQHTRLQLPLFFSPKTTDLLMFPRKQNVIIKSPHH
jgi:hypothetical protein